MSVPPRPAPQTPGIDEGGDRFLFPREQLRGRTVRGVAVNAGFLVLIDAVILAQGLIVTRLLGPDLIGLYGIVTVTVTTLMMLKRVGVDEAFVQQAEKEQEVEFQRAFTMELAVSAGFAVLVCLAAPVVAAVYGDDRLLALTLALAYLPLVLALQAPAWVFFRRMDFVRQRSLQAIAPIVSFAVTVPLAATGFGVWSLVVGPLVGQLAGAAVALAVSPYRLRLRFDRQAARRYLAFSGPILAAALAALVLLQGQVLAFERWGGLEAAGFITLAVTLTRYADRVDQFVVPALYPVVCSIQGQTARLTELFVKSNRATLAWTLGFCAGLFLFAGDLVGLVLGEEWEGATTLIQGMAGAAALQQIGFNWFSFYRAHGDTGPPAVEAWTGTVAFLVLAVPGLALWGVEGFVAGRIAAVVVQLGVRAVYVRRLLPEVRLAPLVARSLAPVALAAGAALALRLATWGDRPPGLALAELLLFLAVFAAASWRLERPLLGELAASFRA